MKRPQSFPPKENEGRFSGPVELVENTDLDQKHEKALMAFLQIADPDLYELLSQNRWIVVVETGEFHPEDLEHSGKSGAIVRLESLRSLYVDPTPNPDH